LAPLLAEDARVLDVGCGTGDLSIELFEKTAARVIGIDFCRPMLQLAKQKAPRLKFIEGDALKLPFADASFDGITVGFALRNLSSVEEGLAELRRVLRPRGWLAILEFSQPAVPGIRQLVRFYYWRLLPWIGGLLSGSRSAYEYLPDSIARFPNQQALATMMRARAGRIINIASIVAQMGNAGQANYVAAKAGLIGLTKAIAIEIASRNVTVNAVAPGFIETPMTDVLADKVKEELKTRIPLGRMGSARDVAAAIVFLASDEAGYITGHVLDVNGGMYLA